MYRPIIISVALGLIFLTGCSFRIAVDPNPRVPAMAQKYPLKAGVLIEQAQLEKVHSQGGFCLVGAAHTWQVPIGEALKLASVKSFSQLFSQVQHISCLEQGKGNDFNIIFTPTIRNFNISQTIVTRFFLNGTIVDSANKVIYMKEVEGKTKGSGPFMTACIGGVAGGQTAFSSSANSAFEDAFEKLFEDMTKRVNFNEIR